MAIGNDSLDWQSFVHEVNDDADGLLARLILVENAAPLADAIDKEACEGCHLVMLNVGGNAWKGTSEGKSVISDLELCREFGENVKRRVANALAAVEQLRTDTPPTEANGKGEATGGKHSPTKPKTLRPCDKKALSQYEYAMEQQATLKTDDEAYDWLVDDAEADDAPLPRRDSWKRMVGRARAFRDQRKNGPRIGNETHSVVSTKWLDTPKRTKSDQR